MHYLQRRRSKEPPVPPGTFAWGMTIPHAWWRWMREDGLELTMHVRSGPSDMVVITHLTRHTTEADVADVATLLGLTPADLRKKYPRDQEYECPSILGALLAPLRALIPQLEPPPIQFWHSTPPTPAGPGAFQAAVPLLRWFVQRTPVLKAHCEEHGLVATVRAPLTTPATPWDWESRARTVESALVERLRADPHWAACTHLNDPVVDRKALELRWGRAPRPRPSPTKALLDEEERPRGSGQDREWHQRKSR